MSKASKWAALDPGVWDEDFGAISVEPVNEWADEHARFLACKIKQGEAKTLISPEEAVSLGKWLIATFGENE